MTVSFTSKLARKAAQMFLYVLSALLVCLILLAGYFFAISPGKPRPIVDDQGRPLAGSLSEKVYVEVNGVQQGMFIQSRDVNNPVLLYLHGGMPDYFLSEIYPTGMEEVFTVVWWEQRGAGMSYSAQIPPETLTLEQMIADTMAVTNYLRERFGQEKIFLMGHSGGTFIGIQAAARAPELYHAYIGVAQMANQRRSEVEAYEYMLAQFKANGNSEMVKKLEAAPVTLEGGIPEAYLRVRDQAMHSLGVGTMREMDSVVTGIFFPSLMSRAYTVPEKLRFWRAKANAGVSILWEDSISTDLSEKVPTLKLPVYFMEGVYDYTCTYAQAKAYFDRLDAPVKGFYTFEDSAHSPMFEEPEKMLEILREDVLTGENRLADGE